MSEHHSSIVLQNARVFDGVSAECREGMSVRIEAGMIREVTEGAIAIPPEALVIDVGGRTLMPGLIDAHVHAYFSDVNWQRTDSAGEAYRTAHAVRMLEFALKCGFTTVRDVGGGDYGLSQAIKDGLFQAPRFFYVGKILSMTGGHGDSRLPSESDHTQGYCTCGEANTLSVVVDGVDRCVTAAREQLRRGAHCVKIMASGGVASPSDPIWMHQFREDEIRAIVLEAAQRHTYVSAHCHPASAARRCAEFGVRVIEHGTLMDEETARFLAERQVYVVPTMAIIHVLAEDGSRYGLPRASQEKVGAIAVQALDGLRALRKFGVKIGFGTDLMGSLYQQQCREFSLRRTVFEPVEILRQATSINAEILQQEGRLGCVRPDACADLLVVEGDPLTDIEVLADCGRPLKVIIRDGDLIKNELAAGTL
jgi:imidazolonepropionase-like amidohydrolase